MGDDGQEPERGEREEGGEPVWVVVRQDEGGNRYRVGHYATRDEARRVCERFDGHPERYLIERRSAR